MQIYKFTETTHTKPIISKKDIVKKYIKGTFGIDNLLSSGIYKIMGWNVDCTDFLNRYLVKQSGHWVEYYAPNKTVLSNVLYGKIEGKIIIL